MMKWCHDDLIDGIIMNCGVLDGNDDGDDDGNGGDDEPVMTKIERGRNHVSNEPTHCL